MTDRSPSPSSLLSIWERGEGAQTGRRALALLAGARPESAPEDLAALPVGRRDALLLDLREQLFGRRYTGLTSCPACGLAVEVRFDGVEVRRDAAEVEAAAVKLDGFDIEFRLPNGGDVVAIEYARDLGAARADLLRRCVTRVSRAGAVANLGDLPAPAVAAIVTRMGELDPQADIALEMGCPSCAHAWQEPFDVVTFLWSELSAWARRLLGEVHVLASAYGWSESEILRLSGARRQVYLEMVR